MHTPAPLVSPEVAFAAFDLLSFGPITVPDHPLRFGFQVDIVPSSTAPHVLFGLATRMRDAEGQMKSYGFAVRIDLKTGEIWDVLNETGLVGWLPELDRLERFTDEEPLLLSWEVEHLGLALIPKLQIANEEWLYPALHCREAMVMDTIAGTMGAAAPTAGTFLHPAVWREHV